MLEDLFSKGSADMKDNLTEVVFILDKSGSMEELTSDTIGGFNSMLEAQKKEDGQCLITTVLFNQARDKIHDRVDVKDVPRMTAQEYQAAGTTALLDAMGETIQEVSAQIEALPASERPGKVMFTIITDGLENSSKTFRDPAQVKELIETYKKQGWEFMFLGANIDAVSTASSFGIDASHSADYVPDAAGAALNFSAVSHTVTSFRGTGVFSETGLNEIRKDMKKRGGR